MGRRSKAAIEAAAAQASEAARILQQRGQEAKNERAEESVEPASEPREDSLRPPIRSRNDIREKAMEEIYAHRETLDEYKQPEASPEDTEEKKEEVPVEAKEEKAEQPAEAAEVAAETTEAQEPPKEELVLVKVDGETFQVPKAEVDEAGGVVNYQKIKAADKRLERAKQIEKELRETQLAQQQAIQQAQNQRNANQQFQVIAAAQQRYQQLLEKVKFGEPQEAFAAQIEINNLMAALQQMRNQNQLSPEDRAVIKTRMLQARDNFNREFPEIAADPDLLEMAAVWENKELSKINPQTAAYNDWDTFYRSLGNRIRAKMGGAKPAPQTAQTQPTSQASEKEARKSSIVTLPSASARATPKKEDQPETREDIINEMKKKRGIPIG